MPQTRFRVHSGGISPQWASLHRGRHSGAPAANLLRRQGYLVPDQAAYESAKAEATELAGLSGQSTSGAVSAKIGRPLIVSGDPDIAPAWNGLKENVDLAPPDTTGAVGPTRYVELINDKFGIYDRNGNVVSTGELGTFAGSPTGDVTDPQIIWDPGTNRFYFVVLDISAYFGDGPFNILRVGFSRTASPSNGTSSWCKYDFLNYGTAIPDYPKLGDSSAFMIVGSNVFDDTGSIYLGSDVAWVSKPPSGTGCPSPAKFHIGDLTPPGLILHDGNNAFTPVPVNQTDTSGTGYVVAAKSPFFPGSVDFLDTFSVTKNGAGDAVIGAPVAHPVTAFTFPANAPQSGTASVLDTLDARLTQAVSGVDPFRGKTAIWTQHTVAGGAGSEARWYEIDPGAAGLLQPQGAASSGSLYVFNAAISPDRKVSGSTKRFGDAMALGFNTSSASDFVRIQMVSKWADYTQSGFVEVKSSPGFNDDFTCRAPFGPPCRWGDYSGATPDPASNAFSNHGRVWLSNQWNVASTDNVHIDWRTYNWGTNPVPFVVLNAPTALFQKGTKFGVTWSLFNQATAADVRYRKAPWNGSFGGPIAWQNQVPAGSATFNGSVGNTYCLSAQSYDNTPSGLRAWGFGPERCAAVPLDDRNLVVSSGWSRRTGSGFYLNTFSRATGLGRSITRTGIHAKSAMVMVEKCPTCGSIKIYWNGSLKHTYSLHASSTRKKVYLSAVSFSSVHTGTLRIVVSSSGKPVIIDALGVSAV
jgi:hypothetical protein